MIIDLDKLFIDREKLIDVLNKESDIGCILVTSSFLDKCLRVLLENSFKKNSNTVDNLFELDGLLSDYSSKAKLCYSLSLIDKKKYNDIIKIAEIRNLTAHTHILLDFNDPNIQHLCDELKCYKDSLTDDYLKIFSDNLNTIARLKFIDASINIINEIMAKGYLNKVLKS